ncbi:DUF2075 domain-containing protein [Ereboglobus luteus]|uniref:Schlafen group 3-like DNA/RNA helicase domain-containing protein n=1 Tax=Ereboglobus luteus TaxID=1796921 RepID=A0A2U8E161_9BACT|nr:DUF2075 domain-containing protein [Ereboglobus luteus]AWI08434.1 hypothetical protein CKA38_03470 [Ereboglobus luteus]
MLESGNQSPGQKVSRAWYQSSIDTFLAASSEEVIGALATNGEYALLQTQRDAWLEEIALLKTNLVGLSGDILLEFTIPRMGKRVDVVLLLNSVVFVVEFKVGEKTFDRASIDQVWDYALDLKNFHEASHAASIVPILIATEASETTPGDLSPASDKVHKPLLVGRDSFRAAIDKSLHAITNETLDSRHWASAPYRPTPTIVEAARALFSRHSVENIARHDAGAQNLRVTSQRIEQLVDEAQNHKRKIICFVTGVPGAGKTLVGLNIATQRRDEKEKTHAVFLSGNGPLVAVLTEVLVRDEFVRAKAKNKAARKSEVAIPVRKFIQNIHHFRDDGLKDDLPPSEHVVIFDEAQRAWNLRQTANFMRRKKGRAHFSQSEPEFLISYMDRHSDWAVIICLVGGGQEINTGEAGIGAWLDAVNDRFPHWQMYISSRLTDTEYAAGHALDKIQHHEKTAFDDSLHLSVSMRSFRSEKVSYFVKALLEQEKEKARLTLNELGARYPIVITRQLDLAKKWLRTHARGSERIGLLASSKALRLKPLAIDIRVPIDPVHWFLNDKDDTRSSYYLEDAATEFQVQGLELDWACVTWDADLRNAGRSWTHHDFRGNRWCNIANEDNRNYLLNAYRVLLTRARQGMVIFVPPGDADDPTRSPEYYDKTYQYLTELGLPIISPLNA